MDFQIKTENLVNFFRKCRFDKIVNDLFLKAEKDKLVARFSDNIRSMYSEVYETSVKIKVEGGIRIANLSKLIDILERFQSDIIRLVSDDTAFVITDGNSAGCGKTKLTQVGELEYVESFGKIKDCAGKMFDIPTLAYLQDHKFEVGYEIPFESLAQILKDAKAFGFEIYKFFEKDNCLNCSIEDKSLGENFTRKLFTTGKLGTTNLPTNGLFVSSGFREMVSAIDKVKVEDKTKRMVKMYFHDVAILLTDSQTYYYILNTAIPE